MDVTVPTPDQSIHDLTPTAKFVLNGVVRLVDDDMFNGVVRIEPIIMKSILVNGDGVKVEVGTSPINALSSSDADEMYQKTLNCFIHLLSEMWGPTALSQEVAHFILLCRNPGSFWFYRDLIKCHHFCWSSQKLESVVVLRYYIRRNPKALTNVRKIPAFEEEFNWRDEVKNNLFTDHHFGYIYKELYTRRTKEHPKGGLEAGNARYYDGYEHIIVYQRNVFEHVYKDKIQNYATAQLFGQQFLRNTPMFRRFTVTIIS
ncbi:hypothetical protein CCACVL1_10984 [Corchorus capsularis]|uniref:Uncharacterized protein n=1 Tax=Corchorus capsularis TaxID=210143 RepID=A0A1R3INK7_COCAP|nr:hypothetical protein CCACVL1_10984 [Corchorus capsularis]